MMMIMMMMINGSGAAALCIANRQGSKAAVDRQAVVGTDLLDYSVCSLLVLYFVPVDL